MLQDLWERLVEGMTEIPHRILLLLRFIAAEWKAVLGYGILAIVALFATLAIAVSCADIASLECHKISYQSTAVVDGKVQPVTVTKDVCTDRRDK